MTAKSRIDGRTVIFKEDRWVFEDNGEPAPTPEVEETKSDESLKSIQAGKDDAAAVAIMTAEPTPIGDEKAPCTCEEPPGEPGIQREPCPRHDCDPEAVIEAEDSAVPVYCERCGWKGYSGDLVGNIGNCPECGSSWKVTEVAMVDPDKHILNEDGICPECSGLNEVSLCNDCMEVFAECEANPTFSDEEGKDNVISCHAYRKDPNYGQRIISDSEETPSGPKRFSEAFADNIDLACIHADPENWPCQWLDLDIGCPTECANREHRKALTLADIPQDVLNREGRPIICPACSSVFTDHISQPSPTQGETCPSCGDATLEAYPEHAPLPPPWDPNAQHAEPKAEEKKEDEVEPLPVVRTCISCFHPIQTVQIPGTPGKILICNNQDCYRVGLVTMVVKPMALQKDGSLIEPPVDMTVESQADGQCRQRKRGKRCTKANGHAGPHQYHPTSTRPKGEPRRGRK